MNTLSNQSLRICGCCKQVLPPDAFYIDKKTQLPNSYCKECRKTLSRRQRETEKYGPSMRQQRAYPVITRTKDPVLRKALILHALQVVAESIAEKNKKRWELEDRDL